MYYETLINKRGGIKVPDIDFSAFTIMRHLVNIILTFRVAIVHGSKPCTLDIFPTQQTNKNRYTLLKTKEATASIPLSLNILRTQLTAPGSSNVHTQVTSKRYCI